jgi:hypothetical protein
MIRFRHATKTAKFLTWSGKSAIPNTNALGGDMKPIDSSHPGWDASGSGDLSRLLSPQDEEQGTERYADDPADRRDDALLSAEEYESRDTDYRAGSEIPERESTGVWEGPQGTEKQDGKEEQRGRDRAPDGQDDEPGEGIAHEYTARGRLSDA